MPFFFFYIHLILAQVSHFRQSLNLERELLFSPHHRAEPWPSFNSGIFTKFSLVTVLEGRLQGHLFCAFSPAYLSNKVGSLEDDVLHLSLIMPTPTSPNLSILLLQSFKTKGYLLFFQDYFPLCLQERCEGWNTLGANTSATGEGEEEMPLYKHDNRAEPHQSLIFRLGENKSLSKVAKS